MNDLRQMIDGYDCGIRYMDDHIGKIFDALSAQGVMEDLAIIISSDHGENLGELGLYGEHATADHTTCHIPMIISWPGCKAGHVDGGLHYNLDLGPTIACLLAQAPAGSWDGQSYSGAVTSGKTSGRDYLVLSQCAHVCQRGLRFGPWLYMRTYHDGYHLFPKEMLFSLDTDPHEEHNIALEHPGLCREAVYYLSEWHDAMMQSMPYEIDPLWTVIKEGGPFHAKGCLPSYCEYLEKTDRAWAIPELKRRILVSSNKLCRSQQRRSLAERVPSLPL